MPISTSWLRTGTDVAEPRHARAYSMQDRVLLAVARYRQFTWQLVALGRGRQSIRLPSDGLGTHFCAHETGFQASRTGTVTEQQPECRESESDK